MTPETSSEAQMLRRRALWFRQFGRLGAREDQSIQDGVADRLHREALCRQTTEGTEK
jgi:hypothetical protein